MDDPEDSILPRVETITETGDNLPHYITKTGDIVPKFPHIPVTELGHERDSTESVNTGVNSNVVNGKITVTSQWRLMWLFLHTSVHDYDFTHHEHYCQHNL